MRSVAYLLIVTMLAPSLAPLARAAEVSATPEGAAPTKLEELIQREEKLHRYFEGCNNHISDTLNKLDLTRDAGDRPTPIMILGMNKQDANAADIPFTSDDEAAMNADVGAGEFLRGIYVQGLRNAATAWVRMGVQYAGAKLDPAAVTEKLCSLGAKCSKAARAIVTTRAREALGEAQALRRYTAASAAEAINEEVDRINKQLSFVRVKARPTFTEFVKGLPKGEFRIGLPEELTPTKLSEYTKAYSAAIEKDGPMRLLAVPRLNSKVGTLQTPYSNRGIEDIVMEYVDARDGTRYPASWSNGFGLLVRDHSLPNDGMVKLVEPYAMVVPHGYVTPAEVNKAVGEGLSQIESLIGDLHDSIAPRAIRNQAKIQEGTVSILGGTGLAAHEVLLDFPELAPSACRAFKQFAIDHAKSHRWDRYKRNAMIATGVVIAILGTVIHVLEIPAYAILSAAVGEATISTISWVVGTALIVNSVVNLCNEKSKLNANIGAVLAGNEAPEVIISRIPEEIDAVASAQLDLLMNIGFGVMNSWYAVKDVQIYMEYRRAAQVAEAAAAATLAKTLLVGTGKILFSTSKFTPVMLKAISYWSFQDLQGTIIQWEENPGSGVLTKGRADLFDDKRQYVKLTILEQIGPDKKPIKALYKSFEMPIDVFRAVIRGTR